MIIYIEDTIIENFLITYLIISIIFSFIREEKSRVRVIVACVFASIIAVFYPLINLNGVLMLMLKLFVGYIIVLIAYKTNSLKKQIFFWIMFLFVTAIYGGINLMIYYSIYGNFESSQKMPTVLIISILFVITYFLKQCQISLYQKK
ncbi:MAG: sigma-E processing peptidase SpoIIGA, partial [Clostridia bacterium]|nr:sigma-E processing peptidase SpoIIGA [Clostridia bacterium]